MHECPQCGASANPSDRVCRYCKAEFFVTSLAYLSNLGEAGVGRYLEHYKKLLVLDEKNVEGLLGIGLCYLEMGTTSLAEMYFKKVIQTAPEIASAYYYAALSSISGRRLKTLNLGEVRDLERLVSTAVKIDSSKAHYKVLLAMLKRDYYEANGMRVPPPTAFELLAQLVGTDMEKIEVNRLLSCVQVADSDYYINM